MITVATLTRLATMLAVGTAMFGAVEDASAASGSKPRVANVRDHRGPNAAPSGGISVDGKRVDMKPKLRPCHIHQTQNCTPRPFRPPGPRKDRLPPVVRDHR